MNVRYSGVPTGSPSYCSHRCHSLSTRFRHKDRAREARHRRRARQRGAYVAPVFRKAIFERDDYTCQLCGDPVDQAAVVPHGGHGKGRESYYAPTIDHIVPLAAGGTHEPSNVQCAHFICNSRKRDQTDPVVGVVTLFQAA